MTLARAHDPLVGRALGGFVLRERIGEGGIGAVYRAIQPALDRDAVVKVLHARLHASKYATDRFLREAKLASELWIAMETAAKLWELRDRHFLRTMGTVR